MFRNFAGAPRPAQCTFVPIVIIGVPCGELKTMATRLHLHLRPCPKPTFKAVVSLLIPQVLFLSSHWKHFNRDWAPRLVCIRVTPTSTHTDTLTHIHTHQELTRAAEFKV